MASAGNRKQPQMINPALRLQKGWLKSINIRYEQNSYTIEVGSNNYDTVFKYTNPLNPKEYLLLYPTTYGKYFQKYLSTTAVADQGLAIYYVDEEGGMDKSGVNTDYKIKLITADNVDELHNEDLRFASNNNDIRGDFNDLYDNVKNSFPAGTPFRWKDGGEFGLHLSNISAPGATMRFTVDSRGGNRHLVTSDKNGDVFPKGVVRELTPVTYRIRPNPGYEINTVKVNGEVTTVTGNTFIVGTGIKRVEVSYKRKADQSPLPAPWKSVNIGSQTPAGFTAFDSDSSRFLLESNSGDIWGSNDNFSFIYQKVAGDATLIARITSMSRINNWSKAGVMIRESLSSNAAYSMLMKTPSNHSRVQQRSATGANATDNPNGIEDLHYYNLYRWLKVERKGDVITSYVSRNKTSWTKLGEQTIEMGNEVYIGLAVSGQNESEATIAQFENVSVVNPNIKPTVSFTTPVEGSHFYPTPDTLTVKVDAFDTDGYITKVEFRDNLHGLVGVDSVAPYSMNFGFAEAGFYYISAKAIDNRGDYGFALTSVTIDEWPVNEKPLIAISSPAKNQTSLAPATIIIDAAAFDPDGTVAKVDFFMGSTLLGTDYSAPYNFVWNNVSAGTYNIVGKVTDNQGEYSYDVIYGIVVTNSAANIIGSVCGSNNATLTYEVSPSKKANATGFNWWYTGSSNGIIPISGNASKVNLYTGSNFSSGQVCVGINYNGAPWYANYCVNVDKCSSARVGEFEADVSKAISYPNPFTSETVIQIPVTTAAAEVQVYDANGVLMLSEKSTGEFRFGNDFESGIYLVKISYDGKSETIKVMKQ